MPSPVAPPRPAVPVGLTKADQMDFPEAMRAVLDGKKIQRVAWPNKDVCVFLADGLLKIRREDGALTALMVSDGDMLGVDWIVVREQ